MGNRSGAGNQPKGAPLEQSSLFPSDADPTARDLFTAVAESVDTADGVPVAVTLEVLGDGDVIGRMHYADSDDYVSIRARVGSVS